MGDGHTVNKQGAPGGYEVLWKIGTAGDYRSVRRSQLEAISAIDAGHQANVPAILSWSSSLYRFPFPDEDARAADPRAFDDRRREPVQAGFALLDDLVTTVKHHVVQIRHGNRDGDLYSTFAAPCPLGPDGRSAPYQWISRSNTVFIVGEMFVQGEPVTVFACQCGKQFHLDERDLKHVYAPKEVQARIHAKLLR